ncbi:MAG: tetratricopeptide repeat protein [Gemmatimonadota bacterium]|nr:tetratricopeptide repeat protein [Gemmatimonadota bacterium]
MGSLKDAQGEPLVAANAGVAAAYDGCVAAYLGARADTRVLLAALLAADPGCVLGHCLDGYLHMLASKRSSVALARESLARAQSALPKDAALRRESLHVTALDAWSRGEMREAAAVWDQLLADFPRDAVALKVSQFVLSYLGESARMLATAARVATGWDAGVPGYGFVLGCHAYALEECGEYASAESIGCRAIEINPADIWAAHAVAHVREMEGRMREGVEWIGALVPQWRPCSNFAMHLRWHEALFRLELREHDGVLALYDADVRPKPTDEYLDVANAVSLLWRLEQNDVSVGSRWRELADTARAHVDDHALVFVDMHYLMALAAGGDGESIAKFLASSEQLAREGRGTEAIVMASVGLPLANAIMAHRRGEYDRAVDLLAPVRAHIRDIGGSHAQRDLFDQLLIDSAMRARRWSIAQSLLAERTSQRPRNAWAWRHYAAALEATNAPGAADARRRVELLLAS